MYTEVLTLEKLFHTSHQWVVPVYQRHYEWEVGGGGRQLNKFWEDWQEQAKYRLDKREPLPHYFGTLIYSEELRNRKWGATPQLYLVDGQQRITTFQLALTAIREVAREFREFDLVNKIDSYIFNPKGPEMVNPEREQFKLLPSHYDRDLYLDIVKSIPQELILQYEIFFYHNGKLRQKQAPKLLQTFWYLYVELKKYVADQTALSDSWEILLNNFLDGFLSDFQIVVIRLDQNDDAQEIFASLNGFGKPLSPFDLIRNNIFHRAQRQGEDAQEIYNLWKRFEEPFWNEEVRQGRFKRTRADHLISHVVVAETGREVSVGKIAVEYQHYVRDRSFPTVAEELNILIGHSETYRAIEQEIAHTSFTKFVHFLRIWDIFTFHPLILWVESQSFDDENKTKFYEICESYIVRREICDLSIKNYNRVVAGIIRNGKSTSDLVSPAIQYLSKLDGEASRIPKDGEFENSFVHSCSLSPGREKRIEYILLQIENSKRTNYNKTTIQSNNLVVDNIMPRRWSEYWHLPNGSFAPCDFTWQAKQPGRTLSNETRELMEARERAIDSMGNLTLLTSLLDQNVKNIDWYRKKLYYEKSELVLNHELAKLDEWNEVTIRKRAEDLAKVATGIWKMPSESE